MVAIMIGVVLLDDPICPEEVKMAKLNERLRNESLIPIATEDEVIATPKGQRNIRMSRRLTKALTNEK